MATKSGLEEGELLFTMPDEDSFGPAMMELTPKQRAFIVAYGITGGDGAKAAVLCGSKPGDVAKNYAYRVTHNPKFGKAAREWAERMIHGGVFASIATMLTIAKDPLHKDAFKAADRILERAGMHVAQVLEVKHEHEVKGLTQLVSEIKQLAQSTGIDARVLLAQAGVPKHVIDAEFTVVQEQAPALPAPASSAGLEDLL